MKLHNLFIFFLIVLSNNSFAKCNKFDAYDNYETAKKNGVITNFIQNGKHLGEVRNQDSIGYCYAYTGADVLEDWLKSKKMMPKDESISALAIGLVDHENAWTYKHQEFLDFAFLKQEFEPVIKEKQEKITELNNKNNKINEKINDSHNKHKKKSPFYSKLMEVEKAFQDELRNRSDGKKTMSDDEFYNLTDKRTNINMEHNLAMEKNAEYIKENEDLLMEKYTIEGEIHKLEKEIARLSKDLYLPITIPEGGLIKESIEKVLGKICYESEVSSSDQGIRAIYDQYQDVYSKLLFLPKNLKQTLGALVESRSQSDNIICNNFHLVKELFPAAPFETEQSYYDFLTKLNNGDNLFSKLIAKSCSKKNINELPDIVREFTQAPGKVGYDPSKVNNMFNNIDKALSENKIAGIAYRSTILDDHELENDKKDFHASSIVGSMNICGEKYYTLRNSYGPESCSYKQKKYLPAEKYKTVEFDMEDNANKCQEYEIDQINNKFSNCSNDQCYEDKARAINTATLRCQEKFIVNRNEKIDHPYFCDEDGNWIISKKQLKKGIFSATVIIN